MTSDKYDMDRHVKWLRRRIIASVATQTAETFAVVAVVAFALMQWRTDEGPLSSLFGAVVVAQLFAVARLGLAMRNNPLNYVFMRKYVERPFNYRVARFQGEEEAHPADLGLPGFAPVATIRDADADPEPCFDIYHDPSRLVAASISRASGSLALVSSLSDGRILVTDARVMPPHERLVISLAIDESFESVIEAHRRAISERTDVVELASSAHQVVLDSLNLEYDSYLALGPALSPFFDLEPENRSMLRLSARIKTEELATLPVRLGPDKPLPDVRVTTPLPVRVEPQATAPVMAPAVEAPQIAAADVPTAAVPAPTVAAPQMVITNEEAAAHAVIAPQSVSAEPVSAELGVEHEPAGPELIVSPTASSAVQAAVAPLQVEACDVFAAVVEPAPAAIVAPEAAVLSPEMLAPEMLAPEAAMPETVSPEMLAVVAPETVSPEMLAVVAPEMLAPEAAVVAPEPVIAPHAFVTVDAEDDALVATGEPITAEVPVVAFTNAAVPQPIAVDSLVAQRLSIVEDLPAAPVAPMVEHLPAAAAAAMVEHLPAPPVAPVAPMVEHLPAPPAPPVAPVAPMVEHLPAPPAPPVAPVAEPLPMPATLAEAVVPAPDSPADLIDGVLAPAPLAPPIAAPPAPVAEPVPNLATALGYEDVNTRPRLSAALRSHPAATAPAAASKRSRRKPR